MSLQSPSGYAHKSSSFSGGERSLVWGDVQIFLPVCAALIILCAISCAVTQCVWLLPLLLILSCAQRFSSLFPFLAVVVTTPRFHRHCNYLQNQSTCALCFYALTCVCVCVAHTKMLWAASLITAHTHTHKVPHNRTQTMRTRWQLQVAFAKSP